MTMRADHLAKEAERLKSDAVLTEALAAMRRDALERLATCDPYEGKEVARIQAEVTAIDGLLSQLGRFILAIQ